MKNLGADSRAALAQLAADIVAGRIHVEIEKAYPFERGVEALKKTETRRARGKVVISMEQAG